jgi:hypothetical protein
MSNVEQFLKVVTDAGAEAIGIARGPRGAERLVIQTPGGLITRAVPLIGDPNKDSDQVALSAREIVDSARSLTAPPARNLSSSRVPGGTTPAKR